MGQEENTCSFMDTNISNLTILRKEIELIVNLVGVVTFVPQSVYCVHRVGT